jgi:hypothetical protein
VPSQIEIFDTTGRMIDAFITNSKGLVRLNTEAYPIGLYVIRLSALNQELDSVKMNITH